MELKYKNFKEILISILVGFSIGFSVIVPGISGSSIAMIMKVYDKMMYAISNLFKKFKICVVFLLPILFGILVGFGVGFILVKTLLEAFPFITICLFIGLMIGTYPILFTEINGEKLNANRTLLFVGGIAVPVVFSVISMLASADYGLTNINPLHYLLFLFLGVMVSLTQLIPGLSATVLLMIFGYYKSLMNGIGSELFWNWELIFVYVSMVVGFLVGTLAFSKIINKLLDNFRKQFFFVICGLSVGSVFAVFLSNDCLDVYKSWATEASNGMVRDILLGFLALAVGFGISFSIYFIDKKRLEKKSEKL